MNIRLIEEVVVVLINILTIMIGLWVLLGDFQKRLNQAFAVMSVFILAWVNFSYLASNTSDHSQSLWFYRLNIASVSAFLITFYYFFVHYFLGKRSRIINLTVVSLGIFFIIVSLATNFEISAVRTTTWGTEPISGPIDNYFSLFSVFVASVVIFFGLRGYSRLPVAEKMRRQYFLVGIFLYIFLNIVFNIIVPSLMQSSQLQDFGDYSSIIFLGFTALAIIKQQLFGMRVVLTSLFVAAINILLFLDVLVLSNSLTEKIVKIVIFVFSLFIGYSLIKSVQREIRRREEIQALSTQLAAANKQLKSLDTLKTEFLSIATHQLRTPLTGIKGYISMIADGDFGEVKPEQKKVLDDVLDNTEKLVHLIADFLDISRIERGKLEINRRPTNIEKMVESIVNIFQPNAQEKRVQLIYHPPKNPLPEIQMDEDKFRQVFLNIVDNAVKYTPTGRIDVYLTKKPDSFLFESRDTGVGMNDADKMRLFQRFSRASDAYKTNATGTGLGMYVAKNVVERHGGKIWAESQGRGRGTSFFVEVPFDQSNIKEPELSPEEKTAQEASKQTEILSKRLQKI